MSAAGTADGSGGGSVEVAAENRPSNFPQNLPVMQPGLYLVEITHPTVAIPTVYNSASTLGLEAGIAGQNPSGVTWELQSKKKKEYNPSRRIPLGYQRRRAGTDFK